MAQRFGTPGDDLLLGTPENDLLIGQDGNDRLDGGPGADQMLGGNGNDTYVVDSLQDTIIEGSDSGIDWVITSVSLRLPTNFENLTLSGTTPLDGAGNDLNNILIGNDAANILLGGLGDDTLRGFGGADVLVGEAGSDRLEGGLGDDTYIVDPRDVIVENPRSGTKDTVRTQYSFSLTRAPNVERLELLPAGNGAPGGITGNGNSLHNEIFGNSLNNRLLGQVGNDLLVGGDGLDRLDGGVGNDTLEGGNGRDTLNGESGNDVLSSGAGNDLLLGGSGSDQFVFATGKPFSSATFGIDTLQDFSLREDVIVLSKRSFTALVSRRGWGFSNRAEFAVVANDTLVGSSSGKIVYSLRSGGLFYNRDGVGSLAGTRFATIAGQPLLTPNNIYVL